MSIDMMATMKRADDPDLVLLAAIADPVRLAILRQLSVDGPTCACDFSDCCDITQPTVSHHLKVLRQAGWIEGKRRGTWIWYSIRADAVERWERIAAGIRRATPRPASTIGPAGSGPRSLPVWEADWRQW